MSSVIEYDVFPIDPRDFVMISLGILFLILFIYKGFGDK